MADAELFLWLFPLVGRYITIKNLAAEGVRGGNEEGKDKRCYGPKGGC